MNYDLINIKKKYGEKMMHFCRASFTDILEYKGLLYGLISSKFAPSKSLYDDLVKYNNENQFIKYIYCEYNSNNKRQKQEEILNTPDELLSEVGYDLYECKTEEEIQSFKKYYARGEELCTFKGGRLNRCYVFFAVKKNVDQIQRKDFINPERQDEYGTSVISIQFVKGDINYLSIKNRYNHTVSNPDSTFSNNLENIIPGLTQSFKRKYNFNFKVDKEQFEMPGYVKAIDGKFYKYNYEINNIYYCPNNIIIDNFSVVETYKAQEKYIVIDYFIIDLVNKKIKLFDNSIGDSFINDFDNVKKIKIKKEKGTKNKIIYFVLEDDKEAVLVVDNMNRIISFRNNYTKKIGDNYLANNKCLTSIYLPSVEKIGDNFLVNNKVLENLDFSKVIDIGNNCLKSNKLLKEIQIPNVEKIGDNFLWKNKDIKYIEIDNLKYVGRSFLSNNNVLKKLVAPKLEYIGDGFLYCNKTMLYVSIPCVIKIGDGFLYENEILFKLEAPAIKEVGSNFLNNNNTMEYMQLPNIEVVGKKFMYNNNSLKVAEFPKLKITNEKFFYKNDTLKHLNLNEVISLGESSLKNNNSLLEMSMPNLKHIGKFVLYKNKVLTKIDTPFMLQYDETFLGKNSNFKEKKLVLNK